MWKEIWIIMLLVAFICLVVSMLLTFIWDVPSLIDELSGRKAKRQIKMLHELNSSTSTFDKLSTNEIYSGISSGTLLNEELNNIDKDEVKEYDNSEAYAISPKEELEDEEENSTSFLEGDEEEGATSYLSEDDEESSTSYMDEKDEEDSTSYLDVSDSDVIKETNNSIKIIVLEEQSSL